jgi:uncharacterized protein
MSEPGTPEVRTYDGGVEGRIDEPGHTELARRSDRSWSRRYGAIIGAAALAVGVAGGLAIPRSSSARPEHLARDVLAAQSQRVVVSGAQITVTGTATVQGTPDTVTFQIGAHSVASTASAALADNNAQLSHLESVLSAQGVPASGMQTSQLDIYANYDNKGTLTGFSVDDDLNVTLHDVSSAGSVLDAAATALGNSVELNGISFSISNSSALLATARAKAMANARTEAEQLASGAGASLGGIIRVTDEENQPAPTFYGPEPLAASTANVPVEDGTQPITVQVSVVYALES